ncbi:helix-turn-helix domain-containing protein [Methylobacterium sp. D53M]
MSPALIRALQDENARLREQLAAMRAALSECPPLPQEWGLTPSQARVFAVLVRRPCPSRTAIMTALYSDRSETDAVDDPTIVTIFVHRMRRKLQPFGVEIQTLRGRGYALDEGTRARFADAVQPALRIAA